MRNKRAKEIRRAIKPSFETTETSYTVFPGTTQIILDPTCFRAIYQRIKRTYRSQQNGAVK